MITEWWYESSIYDLDGDVVLARLTQQVDGTAEILTDGGGTRSFASRDDAARWFADEEYYPLADLYELMAERNLSIDPRIKPPSGTFIDDLVRQMVIPKLQQEPLVHIRSPRLARPEHARMFVKEVVEQSDIAEG